MQSNSVPQVTIDQMREVDKLMVEEIGVSITMMMENASRNIAILARQLLSGSVKSKKIAILCGKGNNGGDGLGAARHLINYGGNITVILAESSDKLGENAQEQYNILNKINTHIIIYSEENNNKIKEELNSANLIIDALLGYNLSGDPIQPYSDLIELASNSGKPILAVDIPSGLMGNTGEPLDPTIKAADTITLALPKTGLIKNSAKQYVGNLYLADLSVPKSIYEKLGINVPILFEKEEVIRVL